VTPPCPAPGLAEKHDRPYKRTVSKGEATRDRIIDGAVRLASREGLAGVSLGELASELGMSKSGLYAHFGSKEALQLQILQLAVARFRTTVVRPALQARRGVPRLRALCESWIEWANDASMPGGCLLVAASVELDDKPGPLRDFLSRSQRDWLATLAKAAQLAIDEGQLRPDLDPQQFAFEMWALALGYHHVRRLLRDPRASARVHDAFERLLSGARSAG
jgi:AcrR family transcriptional regulator